MTVNAVHIFELNNLAYKDTVVAGGKWGKVLLFDPGIDIVFLSNWSSKNISVIDILTRREVYRFDAGGTPRGLMLSKDGMFLYIAQYGLKTDSDRSGTIAKFSFDSQKIIKSIGHKGAQRHIVMAKKSGKYYVSDMAGPSIYAYSSKDDSLLKKIRVYSHPNTIALSPDEKILYVSCRGRNNPAKGYLYKGNDMGRVYIIDTERDEVTEYREGGNQPTGLDVSDDGKYIVSSDFLDNAIRVYKKIK
jgi:DNA-binding beta-propeller fold protein YncE